MADDHIHDLNRFFEHIEARFDEVIKRIAALEERVEHLENTIQAGSDMHRREIVALRADFCALTKGIYKLPVGVR